MLNEKDEKNEERFIAFAARSPLGPSKNLSSQKAKEQSREGKEKKEGIPLPICVLKVEEEQQEHYTREA